MENIHFSPLDSKIERLDILKNDVFNLSSQLFLSQLNYITYPHVC